MNNETSSSSTSILSCLASPSNTLHSPASVEFRKRRRSLSLDNSADRAANTSSYKNTYAKTYEFFGFPNLSVPYHISPPEIPAESESDFSGIPNHDNLRDSDENQIHASKLKLKSVSNKNSNTWTQSVYSESFALRLRELWGVNRGGYWSSPVSQRSRLQCFYSSESDILTGNEDSYELPLCCEYADRANDASYLAVGDEEGYVTIMNTNENKKVRWLAHPNAVFDVSWADNDSKMITASGDRTVRVFDIERSQCICVLRGHTQTVRAARSDYTDPYVIASTGRDGNILIWDIRCTPSIDMNGDRIHRAMVTIKDAHVYDMKSKQANMESRERNSVTSLLFPRHQRNLLASAGSSDGLIKFWDLRYKSIIRNEPQCVEKTSLLPGNTRQYGISSICTDKSGQRLMALSRDSCIYEYSPLTLGLPIRILKWPTQRCDSFYLKTSLSPDGRFVACGSSDNNVYLWEIDGAPAPVILKGHEGEVSAVCWSRYDEQFASCSDDGNIRIWNMRENREEDENPASKHLRSVMEDTLYSHPELVGIQDFTPKPKLTKTSSILHFDEMLQTSTKQSLSTIPRSFSDMSHDRIKARRGLGSLPIRKPDDSASDLNSVPIHDNTRTLTPINPASNVFETNSPRKESTTASNKGSPEKRLKRKGSLRSVKRTNSKKETKKIQMKLSAVNPFKIAGPLTDEEDVVIVLDDDEDQENVEAI